MKTKPQRATNSDQKTSLTNNTKCNCYHESRQQYDEFENEDTGEIVYMDFEVCKDCNAVLVNDKIMGYDT